MTHTVLKIGGSLIAVSKSLITCLVEAQLDVLVVPGGGPFAETVRRYSDRINATAAHWMAILAMNQYAFYLAAPGASLVEDTRALQGGISILLPFKILYESDPLPHSWNATSDSVAGWIAHHLNANIVIATDVDGIILGKKLVTRVEAPELMEETCVDAFLPKLLNMYNLDCTIVNGQHFQRVIDAIQGRDTIGTTIIGRK
ncbi:MAG: amino acid kinase [Euryarchaeota archaeon]|nr:amino acid kinase [Euryarchaeota archaeon]